MTRDELEDAMVHTAAAMGNFAAAWQLGINRDIALHPDLAELNVIMDGFYGGWPK